MQSYERSREVLISTAFCFSDPEAMLVWASKVQANQRDTSDTGVSVTVKPGRKMGALEFRGNHTYSEAPEALKVEGRLDIVVLPSKLECLRTQGALLVRLPETPQSSGSSLVWKGEMLKS